MSCDKSKCRYAKHDLCAKTLSVYDILPLRCNSTIGTTECKFKEIHTRELFVDLNTIYFGNIGLSTTPDGDFFCTINGQQKMFVFGDQLIPGPQGPQGIQGEPGIDDIPIQYTEDKLIVDGMRDVPADNLCGLFYDKNSGEITYDTNMTSYSELVSIVTDLQERIDALENS